MKTLTFVLLAIVIAVDAGKVCVPVPDKGPCGGEIPYEISLIWKKAFDDLANLDAQCTNELNAVSIANEVEYDEFNAEFYTTGHCMTSLNSNLDNTIASLANFFEVSFDAYYGFFYGYLPREGPIMCMGDEDTNLLNASTAVISEWNNIIESKHPEWDN